MISFLREGTLLAPEALLFIHIDHSCSRSEPEKTCRFPRRVFYSSQKKVLLIGLGTEEGTHRSFKQTNKLQCLTSFSKNISFQFFQSTPILITSGTYEKQRFSPKTWCIGVKRPKSRRFLMVNRWFAGNTLQGLTCSRPPSRGQAALLVRADLCGGGAAGGREVRDGPPLYGAPVEPLGPA